MKTATLNTFVLEPSVGASGTTIVAGRRRPIIETGEYLVQVVAAAGGER